MAKAKKEKVKSPERVYTVAGIVFAFVMLLSVSQFVVVYTRQTMGAERGQTIGDAVYNIKENLVSINRDILKIITGVGDTKSVRNDIANSFNEIDYYMGVYEGINDHSDVELKRYYQAKNDIKAFKRKYEEYSDSLDKDLEEAKNVYTQEIVIYQQGALDMFDASMDNRAIYSEQQQAMGRMVFRMVLIIMAILLLLGEIAIAIASKIAKRSREEMEKKQKQAEAADRRLRHSQERINDIAYTNILTGMKNRYALDNDIGEKLSSEPINIAVFDIDNFRNINDIYGYDFGDEYLVQLCDKLKNDYKDFGEIYNIIGNEFCMVFNSDIPDSQTLRTAENIFMTMSSAFIIANIGIQMTVSCCTYHCLPGECSNLSALLMKTDSMIRNIKRNGGNSIQNIANM